MKSFILFPALAEIVSIRGSTTADLTFYVHYVDCKYELFLFRGVMAVIYFIQSINTIFCDFTVNKRLDEWVSVDRLDTRKVQYPRRDGQPGTGVNTPKKTSMY